MSTYYEEIIAKTYVRLNPWKGLFVNASYEVDDLRATVDALRDENARLNGLVVELDAVCKELGCPRPHDDFHPVHIIQLIERDRTSLKAKLEEAQQQVELWKIENESRAIILGEVKEIVGYNNDDGFHSTPGPIEMLRTLKHNHDAYEKEVRRLITEANKLTAEAEKLRGDGERTLNIARGCLDYGGGYRGDPILMGAFHHGIQTVINALEAASKRDPNDTQVNALERIGLARQADAAKGKTEGGK
jgi:hypothetical protein